MSGAASGSSEDIVESAVMRLARSDIADASSSSSGWQLDEEDMLDVQSASSWPEVGGG